MTRAVKLNMVVQLNMVVKLNIAVERNMTKLISKPQASFNSCCEPFIFPQHIDMSSWQSADKCLTCQSGF